MDAFMWNKTVASHVTHLVWARESPVLAWGCADPKLLINVWQLGQ